MEIVQATFRPGEGKEAVELLETLGLDIEDYKLIESDTGDLLLINLLYGNRDALLDNLESYFDFSTDKKRSLVIIKPETVIPRNEEKLKQENYRHTRQSLVTYAQENSQLDLEYIILVLASTMVVTLGLILNNTAVIIGGMVIAPVLGPIMALTIGIVLGNTGLIKQGLVAEIVAVLLAIGLSVLITLILPVVEITPALKVRIYPTLADLLIALGAGAAAAYTLIKSKEPLGLVGVMVAAALLPVMATAGVGLALYNWVMIRGALLLLGGNYLGLLLSNLLVFYVEGLRPQIWYKSKAKVIIKKSLFIILFSILLLGIPLTAMTVYQFYSVCPEETIENIIFSHLNEKKYRIEEIELATDQMIIHLSGPEKLSKEALNGIRNQTESQLESKYQLYFRLTIIQEEYVQSVNKQYFENNFIKYINYSRILV